MRRITCILISFCPWLFLTSSLIINAIVSLYISFKFLIYLISFSLKIICKIGLRYFFVTVKKVMTENFLTFLLLTSLIFNLVQKVTKINLFCRQSNLLQIKSSQFFCRTRRFQDIPKKVFAPLLPRWRPGDKSGNPTKLGLSFYWPTLHVPKIKLRSLKIQY